MHRTGFSTIDRADFSRRMSPSEQAHLVTFEENRLPRQDAKPITRDGHALLEKELSHRAGTERPRIIEQLRRAISDDFNLAENSAYQATLLEQERNETRIAQLEEHLAHVEVVDVSQMGGDIIRFGALVTLIDEDTRQRKTWQIVGEPEADVSKGRISIASPLARALIGQRPKASVEVRVPDGFKSFQVQKVEWPTEAGRNKKR